MQLRFRSRQSVTVPDRRQASRARQRRGRFVVKTRKIIRRDAAGRCFPHSRTRFPKFIKNTSRQTQTSPARRPPSIPARSSIASHAMPSFRSAFEPRLSDPRICPAGRSRAGPRTFRHHPGGMAAVRAAAGAGRQRAAGGPAFNPVAFRRSSGHGGMPDRQGMHTALTARPERCRGRPWSSRHKV